MLGGVRLLIKRSTTRRFFFGGGRTEKKEEKRKPCTAGRIGLKTRGENRSRTHRKNLENSGTTLRHTKKIEEGPEAKTQEQNRWKKTQHREGEKKKTRGHGRKKQGDERTEERNKRTPSTSSSEAAPELHLQQQLHR
ncbi:hypothetical protein NC652_037532 [Populus alba x Populus x berolinensis]|nr:hypothetical protein NC652_037532 [Populus alba x Populus x berolinensis]